jgi:DNA-binding MarR family transcriptional regulator
MDYLTNLLGALATGVSDLQGGAMDTRGAPRADLEALLAVHVRPGSSVGDIAVTIGLTHSGAVRVIDRLCGQGWVARSPGLDRRKVQLRCTDLGHENALACLSIRHRALNGLVARLAPKEVESLTRIAQALLMQLPQERSDAWRICRLCDHGVCDASVCPVGEAVS